MSQELVLSDQNIIKLNDKFVSVVYKPHPLGGKQLIVRCSNGYGASIVQSRQNMGGGYFLGSYGVDEGKYELAVIVFPIKDDFDKFALCYSTPITDNVIGYLDPGDVMELLNQISELPSRE